MSHEAICSCNLQCNFCRKKYCRLQLGCQIICNEIIFYARRVFKNVSGILIMSYCDWFLLCETSCKHGVSHEEIFLASCNATPLRHKLQEKLPRVTWPLPVSWSLIWILRVISRGWTSFVLELLRRQHLCKMDAFDIQGCQGLEYSTKRAWCSLIFFMIYLSLSQVYPFF